MMVRKCDPSYFIRWSGTAAQDDVNSLIHKCLKLFNQLRLTVTPIQPQQLYIFILSQKNNNDNNKHLL